MSALVTIAFICTGNTGRSLTAQVLAERFIKAEGLPVAVISRGVDVDPFGVAPEENAATLLKRRGLDVSGHRAAQATIDDVRRADVILTMSASHRDRLIAQFPDARDKTFLLSEYATGKIVEIADAYGRPMAVYEAMFAAVSGLVPAAVVNAVAKVVKP